MIFLQINPGLDSNTVNSVNKVWEVNPYNALGYGLALVVLSVVAYTFYLKAKEAEAYARELSKQMVEVNKDVLQVMVKVELRLNDQQPLINGVNELRTAMTTLIRHSEDILSRIEKKM